MQTIRKRIAQSTNGRNFIRSLAVGAGFSLRHLSLSEQNDTAEKCQKEESKKSKGCGQECCLVLSPKGASYKCAKRNEDDEY